MKKISKRVLLVIVLLLCMIGTSCSCSNDYETFPDGVTLHVATSFQEYMLHPDNLPTLTFDYPGVNAMLDAEGSACFFVQNDQFALSDKFAEHLKRYSADQIIVVSKTNQEYDTTSAHFLGESYLLDEYDLDGNEQTTSLEYQIVCTNNDGTRYSYQYRTFTSGGKAYYVYRYSSNMGISMDQPLQVITDSEGNRKLVLVPLPYDTKYQLSASSSVIKNLITKDEFLDEQYSKYAYPDYLNDYGEADTIRLIKEWYTKYCNGHEDNGDFIIEYYGVTFKVTFDESNCGASKSALGFKLQYVK